MNSKIPKGQIENAQHTTHNTLLQTKAGVIRALPKLVEYNRNSKITEIVKSRTDKTMVLIKFCHMYFNERSKIKKKYSEFISKSI